MAGWSEFSVFFIVKGIILLTFLIILPIHLILNTPTRQAIHDLLVKTYVISLDAYPRQQLEKSRSLPAYITAGLSIIIIGLFVYMNLRNNDTTGIIHELKPLKEQIDIIDKVGNSSIARHTSSMKKIGSDEYINKTEYLKLNIVLKENLISNLRPDNIEDLSFVQDAINIIVRDYPNINQLDYIHVNLIYGYNIGIYKSSESLGFSNTIEKWRQKIK